MNILSTTGMEAYCSTSLAEATQTPESVAVHVKYEANMRRTQLVEAIGLLKNPQVIFWYIGIYGLRQEGVNYYRKDLSKILQTTDAACQLYDLTAWLPFSPLNKEGSLEAFNQNADLINRFAIPRLKCQKSCEFFSWLNSLKPGRTMDQFKAVLKRPFIYQLSEGFSESVQSIGEIFKSKCPVLEEIYELKASKCYSALQYLEGIYLIQMLVREALKKDSESLELNLIFALPNKEYLYYQDDANSLATDVKEILAEACGEDLKGKTVNLLFYSFQFGDGEKNRPYNAGTKNIDILQSPSDILNIAKFEESK